jgi:hypothetical protein
MNQLNYYLFSQVHYDISIQLLLDIVIIFNYIWIGTWFDTLNILPTGFIYWIVVIVVWTMWYLGWWRFWQYQRKWPSNFVVLTLVLFFTSSDYVYAASQCRTFKLDNGDSVVCSSNSKDVVCTNYGNNNAVCTNRNSNNGSSEDSNALQQNLTPDTPPTAEINGIKGSNLRGAITTNSIGTTDILPPLKKVEFLSDHFAPVCNHRKFMICQKAPFIRK